MLISCGTSVLTQPELQTIFRSILSAINEENDPGFLSSLYKSINDAMLVIPANTIPPDLSTDIISSTQSKLRSIGQRRKGRFERAYSQQAPEDAEEEREDMLLMEELEDFALDEIARLLRAFDPNHLLLITVSSVRELGIGTSTEETDF